MSSTAPRDDEALGFVANLARATSRRTFLQWAGLTVGVAAIGCSDDNGVGPGPMPDGENLGSGDTGILNYAYALDQLEAAFYMQAVAMPYAGMTTPEMQILTDIRDHEIIHREFLKTALGANAIGMLDFDFASVNFSSRASVLGTAKVFEDLGVSAYNGAGQLLTSAALLGIAGKIVSVEARHASVIRDLLNPGSADFSGDDVVTPSTGLDVVNSPSAVLSAAGSFITTPISATQLPTS
jgi:hypothetical protein